MRSRRRTTADGKKSTDFTRQPSPSAIQPSLTAERIGRPMPQLAVEVPQPVRARASWDGQQRHPHQEMFLPRQRLVGFSVAPPPNVVMAPLSSAAMPSPNETLRIIREIVPQEVLRQPVLQPARHPMPRPVASPVGPPIVVRSYFEQQSHTAAQMVNEPIINCIRQSTPQFAWGPVPLHVMQPAKQFVAQASAQRQVRPMTCRSVDAVLRTQLQTTGVNGCFGHVSTFRNCEAMTVEPQQTPLAPLLDQTMTEQVPMKMHPVTAPLATHYPGGQCPNDDAGQASYFIPSGIPE